MGDFPNKDTQFKPGESGNPAGRPKGARSLRTVLKELLAEEITIHEKDKNGNIQSSRNMLTLDAMALKQIRKALNGDTNSFRELMDRYEGRPQQSVTLGLGDEPITGIQVQVLTDKGQFEAWKKMREEADKAAQELSDNQPDE